MVSVMLRAVALILAVVAFTGCEQRQATPLRLSSDHDLRMAQILGVRIGMTPRKLHNQIAHLGLEESNFNRETLQDIIFKFDRGASEHTAQIIFSKGVNTLSALDDVTFTVGFCFGHIDSISIDERIHKKNYEKRKLKDLRMFPKIVEGPIKDERIMFTAKYVPDKFSSAQIAYLDRGYSDLQTRENVINRMVWIVEGISCYNRSIQRELL